MFLRDYTKLSGITQTNATLLYVTHQKMFSWYILPSPIKILKSVLTKRKNTIFTHLDDLHLAELDVFVTKETFQPHICINVDFGEYDIKRR